MVSYLQLRKRSLRETIITISRTLSKCWNKYSEQGPFCHIFLWRRKWLLSISLWPIRQNPWSFEDKVTKQMLVYIYKYLICILLDTIWYLSSLFLKTSLQTHPRVSLHLPGVLSASSYMLQSTFILLALPLEWKLYQGRVLSWSVLFPLYSQCLEHQKCTVYISWRNN